MHVEGIVLEAGDALGQRLLLVLDARVHHHHAFFLYFFYSFFSAIRSIEGSILEIGLRSQVLNPKYKDEKIITYYLLWGRDRILLDGWVWGREKFSLLG